MRSLFLVLVLMGPVTMTAQNAAAAVTQPATELRAALAGDWVGVLEYRDYKEPAGSLKRVDLPTWLTVRDAGSAQSWHYVYDDGPGETVDSTESVAFDVEAKIYTATPEGKPAQHSTIAGLETLKQGRGVLVMSGTGTDNNKPAEMRLTLTLHRNLLELLQEVRTSGSNEEFSFRHLYRMVRAAAPAVTTR